MRSNYFSGFDDDFVSKAETCLTVDMYACSLNYRALRRFRAVDQVSVNMSIKRSGDMQSPFQHPLA